MDVHFLYPRGNDILVFKIWTTEIIEKRQVFARNLIKLTVKGDGYSVMGG